jgi:hyperosmotically inducible protein
MFRALLLALLLVAIVWGFFYFYEGGEIPIVGGSLDDARITASVKAALALHRDLAQRPVSVRTRGAVVTLTGQVATGDEKARAEALVSSVEGVQEVDNLIAVSPDLDFTGSDTDRSLGQKLDDTALAAKVKGAFALHRELRGLDITARVREGTVQLEGDVETPSQAELAREWALSVEGVRGVDNRIRVMVAGAEVDPEQLAKHLEAALEENENLGKYHLRASTRDGSIVLQGEVTSGAEKELAELLAERFIGNRDLKNEIRVKR